MRSRARVPLEKHFESVDAARDAALAALKCLHADDFVETVLLAPRNEPADVFAVLLDDRDWYVKLYLTVDLTPPHHDVVVCVSFHVPERAMTTVSGRKVNP
jgi:hypothetical protein